MEEWRPYYLNGKHILDVSSLGNVRDPETLLPSKICDKGKYLYVQGIKKVNNKMLLVHRLVAETFLDNPNGYDIVNHKDENKHNNIVDNLEWCTSQYNVLYGTGIERSVKTKKENKERLHNEFLKKNEKALSYIISNIKKHNVTPLTISKSTGVPINYIKMAIEGKNVPIYVSLALFSYFGFNNILSYEVNVKSKLIL